MRTRAAGSLLVVVVGLASVFLGGPVFALVMAVIGCAGFREFLWLAERVGARHNARLSLVGYLTIAAMALLRLTGADSIGLFAVTVVAAFAPLTMWTASRETTGGMVTWSLISTGALYLGLPVYAAVAVRSLPGAAALPWLEQWTTTLSLGWDAAPRGLAWTLLVVLVTWTNDTAAYLVGRAVGAHKLAPAISPGKTIEGSLGGLVGALLVGGGACAAFGLAQVWVGAFVGALLGVAGQCGDLSESFLKRQAGVKDSGAVLPGHGGVLDRIDALFFAFPTALVVVTILDRLAVP